MGRSARRRRDLGSLLGRAWLESPGLLTLLWWWRWEPVFLRSNPSLLVEATRLDNGGGLCVPQTIQESPNSATVRYSEVRQRASDWTFELVSKKFTN